MAYSTPADVRNALAPGDWSDRSWDGAGDLPWNRTGTAADLPDAQIADQIQEADDLIDSYIGGRYAAPVAAVPESDPVAYPTPIRTWSRNIAAYNATLTNRKGKDLTTGDPVALRYAQTMTAMTAVRDGKATLALPGNEGTPGDSAGAGSPSNPYSGALFGQSDFDLYPVNTGWPYVPDLPPSGFGPNGRW